MTYNMTGVTEAQNLLQFFSGVNTASGNVLSYGFMILIWMFLTFIMLRQNPVSESILASSFVCSIISLLFMAAGIVNVAWFVGFTLLTAAAAVSLYLNR